MECSWVLVFDCLLGGLLLLLLLLLSLTFIFTFSRSSFLYWRGSFFFLFFLLDSNKQANNVLKLDHVVLINLKLVEESSISALVILSPQVMRAWVNILES